MMLTSELETRVERGCDYMDSVAPGWFKRIDLVEFDIASSCRCVLGQVFGSFGRHILSSDHIGCLRNGDDPSAYGFDISWEGEPDNIWEQLDALWITAILKRQSAEPVNLPGPAAPTPAERSAVGV